MEILFFILAGAFIYSIYELLTKSEEERRTLNEIRALDNSSRFIAKISIVLFFSSFLVFFSTFHSALTEIWYVIGLLMLLSSVVLFRLYLRLNKKYVAQTMKWWQRKSKKS